MTNKTIKNINMNSTRTAVMRVLKDNTDKELTLSEISELAGVEVKSGTTNAMVSAGLIRKVGTRKVAVVRYVEVATYALGDNVVADGATAAN